MQATYHEGKKFTSRIFTKQKVRYSGLQNSKSPMQPSLHPSSTGISAFPDQTTCPGLTQQLLVCGIARLLPVALVRLEDAR